MNEQDIKELDRESKKILLVFLSFIVITIMIFGMSYAFFSYSKEGTKQVSVSLGSVKLHYQEGTNQINLTNALPMDDTHGKAQTDYFEFTITSETTSYEIPYYVASRINTIEANRIPTNYISLYLTEVVNNSEVIVLDTTYDTLTSISKNNHIEQQLMLNTVAANTGNYEKTYRLRMWINEDADYSPVEENGIQTYPMQDKEFAITINVYTEAEAVNETCDLATLGDKYCFDTECFIVIDSNCTDTVLLAEKPLDFYTDDYCEKTDLQEPHHAWYKESYINYCPVNTDDNIDISDVIDVSLIENEIGPGKTYDGDFDASTEIPYPYVYNSATDNSVLKDYITLIKKPHYNFPTSATLRLPSYEEIDKVKDTQEFLAFNPTDNYTSILTGSVGERTYNNITTIGLYAYDLYEQDFYVAYSSTIKPVMIIPTSDLPQSALTSSFLNKHMITYYATTFESKFNIDIDSIGIDYNIVDGYIDNTRLDGHEDELNDNRLFIYRNQTLTNEELLAEYKKIFNYVKNNLSDDGKIYSDIDSNQELDFNNLSNINSFSGEIMINGSKAEISLFKEWETRFKNDDFPYVYNFEICVEIQ